MPLVLLAIAIAGTILRLVHVAGLREAWTWLLDYDLGVYFGASALLVRGYLPYRDFNFCHPPGALLLLAPVAAIPNVIVGFPVSRWLVALVGGANTFLVGAIARGSFGSIAGLAGALLYATYGEAILAEQGPFLEPFLNLACLGMAVLWLRRGADAEGAPLDRTTPPDRGAHPRRRAALAGALAGLALAIKLWGVLWIAAAVASDTHPRSIRASRLPWLALGAMLAVLLVALPFYLASPSNFLESVLRFQTWVPATSRYDPEARILDIFSSSHLVAALLGVLGLALASGQIHVPTARAERFFVAAYSLTLLAFLASKSFFAWHYTVHLAASECVLGGLAASQLLASGRLRPVRAAALVVLVVVAGAYQLQTVRSVDAREPGTLRTGWWVRQVPPQASIFSFEPAWLLAGGRIPGLRADGTMSWGGLDPHCTALEVAMRAGGVYPTQIAAIRSPAAQESIRGELERADFVLAGLRGSFMLSDASNAWRAERFVTRSPASDDSAADLWQRKGSDATLGSGEPPVP